jgi:ElaB/YqjD/DUF883 family membrane-anchored ribosome-binding protein
MNTSVIRDSVEHLKDTARDAYEDLKTAAHDHIVDPLAATGRKIAGAARDGMESATDCGRRSLERTESWISSNPLSAVGVAFGTGILAGVYLLSKCRR